MNASDVHKLVPSLALNGCINGTSPSGSMAKDGSVKTSGKCVQLKGHFTSNNQKKLKGEESLESAGCVGEADLCKKINTVASQVGAASTKQYGGGWVPKSKKGQSNVNKKSGGDCSRGDVTCTLLEKVRWYLKQHYKDRKGQKHGSGETAISTKIKHKLDKPIPQV